MGTFEVLDGLSTGTVFRHLDEARYAGLMGHFCNGGATLRTIGAAAWHARFPARNGAEGGELWVARKKA